MSFLLKSLYDYFEVMYQYFFKSSMIDFSFEKQGRRKAVCQVCKALGRRHKNYLFQTTKSKRDKTKILTKLQFQESQIDKYTQSVLKNCIWNDKLLINHFVHSRFNLLTVKSETNYQGASAFGEFIIGKYIILRIIDIDVILNAIQSSKMTLPFSIHNILFISTFDKLYFYY